jgi:hypothetical protein
MRIVAALSCVVGLALPAEASHAAELNDYLFAAIRNGTATGEVGGPVVQMVTAKTGSSGALVATVTAVAGFANTECKRLQVRLRKSGVPSVQGSVVDLNLPPFEINMCLDGKPPMETLSPSIQTQQHEAAQAILSRVRPPPAPPGK